MGAERLDSKEMVSFEELLMSNVIEQEALINLLEAKGIIKRSELFEGEEMNDQNSTRKRPAFSPRPHK